MNAVSGTFASMRFSGGNFGFDGNVLGQSVFGKGAMAGYASSLASSFTSNTLNEVGARGYLGQVYGNMSKLNGTIGSLVGQGVSYATTGNAAFNVLNLADFTGNPSQSMGLLELDLGSVGMTSRLGGGGADLSLGALGQSLAGLEGYAQNWRIATSGKANVNDYAVAMRTLYSNGQADSQQLYEELLSGKSNLIKGGTTGQAETVANTMGGRDVHINDFGGPNNDLKMGVLLSHESYRDGKVTTNNNQETFEAVLGHSQVAQQIAATYGKDVLTGQMAKEADLLTKLQNAQPEEREQLMKEFGANLANYSSEGDFWKLRKDGTLVNDGKTDLVAEDGTLLMRGVDGNMLGSYYLFSGRDSSKMSGAETAALLKQGANGGQAHGLARNAYSMVEALRALESSSEAGSFAAKLLDGLQTDHYTSVSDAVRAQEAIGAGFVGLTMGSGYVDFAGTLTGQYASSGSGGYSRLRALESTMTGWSEVATTGSVSDRFRAEFGWNAMTTGSFVVESRIHTAVVSGSSNPFYARLMKTDYSGFENTTAAMRSQGFAATVSANNPTMSPFLGSGGSARGLIPRTSSSTFIDELESQVFGSQSRFKEVAAASKVANAGPGVWRVDTAAMSAEARAWQGVDAYRVPWKTKPSTNMRDYVDFDGWDSATSQLIDRKWNVTGFDKSVLQAQRQATLAQQYGLTVRWEVPANRLQAAQTLLRKAGTGNTITVVVP